MQKWATPFDAGEDNVQDDERDRLHLGTDVWDAF
jgi:hypothetical protein